jgi:hypothetical protein
MIKNIIIYYFLIFIPLTSLVVLRKTDEVGIYQFVAGLFIYVFIYHPFISGLRLKALNYINRSEFYKCFIPGWITKYFGVLFFDRTSI